MAPDKIYKHLNLAGIFVLALVVHISIAQQQQQQQQQFQQPPQQNFQQQRPQQNFQQQPQQDFRQPPQQFNPQQPQQNFQERQPQQENFPLLPPVFIPPNQPVGPAPSLQSPVRNLFRDPGSDDGPLASLFNRITRFFSFN